MGTRASSHTQAAATDQMAAWCDLFEGCQRIREVVDRQPATVLGVIQRLRLVPGESIEAVITDGTGRIRAIFTGEPITGLELGQGLRLEGTVCRSSASVAVMRNPSWRILRDPYACKAALADERDAARTDRLATRASARRGADQPIRA